MKEIKEGFVYSEDIKRIFNGVNAFDYKYSMTPSDEKIDTVKDDLQKQLNQIFKGKVTKVLEEEMLMVNSFIGGEYPHCIFG